jgi:hypothetical protein
VTSFDSGMPKSKSCSHAMASRTAGSGSSTSTATHQIGRAEVNQARATFGLELARSLVVRVAAPFFAGELTRDDDDVPKLKSSSVFLVSNLLEVLAECALIIDAHPIAVLCGFAIDERSDALPADHRVGKPLPAASGTEAATSESEDGREKPKCDSLEKFICCSLPFQFRGRVVQGESWEPPQAHWVKRCGNGVEVDGKLASAAGRSRLTGLPVDQSTRADRFHQLRSANHLHRWVLLHGGVSELSFDEHRVGQRRSASNIPESLRVARLEGAVQNPDDPLATSPRERDLEVDVLLPVPWLNACRSKALFHDQHLTKRPHEALVEVSEVLSSERLTTCRC